jgi:hypothetical protein
MNPIFWRPSLDASTRRTEDVAMIEDEHRLSAEAAAKIRTLREAQRRDPRIVMSTSATSAAIDQGPTRVRELQEKGELSSIVDGKLRRIFVASVYDYLVRRIIETDPVDGPPKKSSTGRFKSKVPALGDM